MEEIVIRSIQTADRTQWQRLWAQYNAYYGRSGEAALTKAVVDTTWERLLDDAEPVHGLIATQGPTSVGLAHYIFHQNTIQIDDTCYLQDLFTAEFIRGAGIGRKLIEEVAARCRERGVKDMYWHTHSNNRTARRLYDKLSSNTEFLVYRRKLGSAP